MNARRSYPGKAAFVIANPKSSLMDQVREVIRVKHYSFRTEEAYTGWVMRYLKYHWDQSGEWKHPRDLGSAEVVGFLNHLACEKAVSAATQNQALNAIVFLYPGLCIRNWNSCRREGLKGLESLKGIKVAEGLNWQRS